MKNVVHEIKVKQVLLREQHRLPQEASGDEWGRLFINLHPFNHPEVAFREQCLMLAAAALEAVERYDEQFPKPITPEVVK